MSSFVAQAGVIYEDGFESGLSHTSWTPTKTFDGRVAVSSSFRPASGANHLVFDDQVVDAFYSASEATLRQDLSRKKNVVLQFKAKSLGNEPHESPTGNFTATRNYDGVAISADGGTTWRSVQSLANVATQWETFVVQLDAPLALLGGNYGANFLIRFSVYDNSSVPMDGVAIDDVSLSGDDDQRVVLELAPVVQEAGEPYTGYAVLGFPSTKATNLTFSTRPAGQLSMPSMVTIPAGEAYASFTYSVIDDSLLNLSRVITVTPIVPTGITAAAASVRIDDNEAPPVATLILPTSVAEGSYYSGNASISLNVPAAVPVVFSLTTVPMGEISLPDTVTVPAGQTQVSFTVQAENDSVLDGNIVVSVTAAAQSLASVVSQTVANDNEIPSLIWTLPASLTEGTAGVGTIGLSSPLGVDLDVFLGSSASGTLSVPNQVTIPAGALSAEVALQAANDSQINFVRTVTLTASGRGVSSESQFLSLTDDEIPPALSVTIPATLTEGEVGTGTGTVSLSFAVSVPVSVSLSSFPFYEIWAPSTVRIPAGQTSVSFTISALDDTEISGNTPVILTAMAEGIATATAPTTKIDNDSKVLSFALPSTLLEGETTTGTVEISGTLPEPLLVNLSGNSLGTLAIPSSVTIPAGNTQATFSMIAGANTLKDGTRTVNLTATAGGFASATGAVIVRDDEVAGYMFSNLTDLVISGSPLTVTVSASDIEGNPIPGIVTSVALSVVLPDGTSQALVPSNAVISGSAGWTGAVTIPMVVGSPLKLRATDGSGEFGDSIPFDLMRSLELKAADLLWDQPRARIYASVPAAANGPHANKVVAIDPVTLQITGSVTTNHDPGKIVMTSGGEYLYVALNGNGTVAKINLATMSVASTFSVGVSQHYGTLYAEDMCAVAGQPELLIVSQYRKNVSPSHNGVAVYDNGVIRPVKTQDHTGSNVIEPSADPTVFYGYNTESTEFGFRSLKLSSSGITETQVTGTLIGGFTQDIRSAGNLIYSNNGVAVNGPLMKRAGTFPTSGLVCPDAGAGRVFFLESDGQYYSNYGKFSAFDPSTFTLIRRITTPPISSPKSLIRWGANGVAFSTPDSVMLFSSTSLIPSAPPADLVTTVVASPNPAAINSPLTYTAQVTNNGPNPAAATTINVTLSDSQTLVSAVSSSGTPIVSDLNVSLDVGNLAVGATATISLVTTPLSAGSLTCTASASSVARDPNFANNSSFKLVSVDFQATANSINQLRLMVNGIVANPTRNLLWATIPSTVEAPLGRSVVSINPTTGLISDPIPLNAIPSANVLALSANGRYLYAGLSDIAEISRLDLSTSPPTIVRIPLGLNGWGGAGLAADIEVLDGDGTSIIATTTGDDSAIVFDGTTRRANRTGIYTVSRVERTSSPETYVGYETSSFDLTRLAITSSGVSISQEVDRLLSGYSADIRGAGDTLLSTGGFIVNSNSLTLRANLGTTGRPCIDIAYKRAYLVSGTSMRAFDSDTGASTGSLSLPATSTGDWATNCIRWGLDGFAIPGNDGKIYIVRWSETIPAAYDLDSDGISDSWAVAHFGSKTVPTGDSDQDGIPDRLEYLFGMAPTSPSRNPLSLSLEKTGGNMVMHLSFPRRAGVTRPAYWFEISSDMQHWASAPSVTETILSTETVDGVSVESVDAAIPVTNTEGGSRFLRIGWK